MKQESIFKRENGDKVKIVVELIVISYQLPEYRISVETCAKGKRTWDRRSCTDDYSYRNLPFAGAERKEYEKNFHLTFATAEEISTAKLALWMSIKP